MTRTTFVPAHMLPKIWRALIEFDMLSANDRILVGLSGGKDSMFLTAALAEIRRYSPVPFELACYTMDARFEKNFPRTELKNFCARFGLEHYSEEVDVTKIWESRGESARRGNTPCFTCAYFRRAATNRFARAHGFNKVAWAHHHDDAVDTFALNLFATGQLKTFLPVTHLSRSGITLIRPLLYYREEEIRALVRELGFVPLKNPCRYDGHTERQRMKELIPKLEKQLPNLYERLTSAMRLPVSGDNTALELWPPAPTQKNLQAKFRAFWKK